MLPLPPTKLRFRLWWSEMDICREAKADITLYNTLPYPDRLFDMKNITVTRNAGLIV